MNSAGLLLEQDVLAGLRPTSKKRVLAEMAAHAGRRLGIAPDLILDALLRREDLGSTGLGDGIAIPHTRMAEVATPFGVLARLRGTIDFEAVDERPVDLVFALLLPSDADGRQLKALACVARKLRDPRVANAMRTAREPNHIWKAFIADEPQPAIRPSVRIVT